MAKKLSSSSKKASAPQPKRRLANRFLVGLGAFAGACFFAAIGGGQQPAGAIVFATPPPDAAAPKTTPSSTPNGTLLPLGSSLFFVLDDTISSKSTGGTYAKAHLRDPIVLHGLTVAPAGAPVQIRVVAAQPAKMGNEDGSVEIYFEPLPITGDKELPLSTPTSHLDPNISAGQANTQQVTDTVGDIFIPYHVLYHALRKGRDVTLRPGTVVRARTAATIDFAGGALAIATPRPFPVEAETPHPYFSPAPLATPADFHKPVITSTAKP